MGRQRVVVVGAGFAGFHAARSLSRLAQGAVEIMVVNPTDYFLYLPLLPEVAGGVLDPRRVTVSLTKSLPGVRLRVGEVDRIDIDGQAVSLVDQEGRRSDLEYDRLLVTSGSVSKLLPIPGVAEHGHGFRGIPEALYLRDHLIRQLELAAVIDDIEEGAARCTFVVVGAGYTGTEVAAQGQLLTSAVTDALVRSHGRAWLDAVRPRWMLLDVADRVLPGLDERLAAMTQRVLERRGVEVRMGTSVAEADAHGVRLTDDDVVPTRTLVWCVGVRPDPLVERLGLPLRDGRLVVDEYLSVPGHPEMLACGDVAAVPDLTRPGELTAMTAQHASRQGRVAAHNIAASYGKRRYRPYRHRNLGFVVDLGGWQAAANPLKVPLSGPVARAVARGYHLAALPAGRVRTGCDWLLETVTSRPTVQLGLLRGASVPLDSTAPETPTMPEKVRAVTDHAASKA